MAGLKTPLSVSPVVEGKLVDKQLVNMLCRMDLCKVLRSLFTNETQKVGAFEKYACLFVGGDCLPLFPLKVTGAA